ncbi:triose-phosphate isomerase [Stagnihabitans tardus]|uniref:Triosephosphate isomerase n=1 Tax=Stagnihabitans tardus TaxID=2699202 RepID=A0AAE5BVW7_9RHOB|nr:triose-phosphate isomerase [Stagnihabitans tardus]NBZ89406.1 triose-phosphate isomerase [Stagnihabitans tardus]
MKKTWVGTSWKMNKTLAEALAFADALARQPVTPHPDLVRFILPPFTALREVKARLAATDVRVGAQNMHWDDAGAWTGEISPAMLTDCGADVVEIGHSERREFFNETNETVGRKAAAAIRHGLVPVICIGESLETRNSGGADAFLAEQVHGALAFLDTEARKADLVIAYEPIWAIGVNGIPATTDYAVARHASIAALAADILGRQVPILYGGSVNPGNCAELVSQPEIDGLFIGRSAWTASGYLDILERVARVLTTQKR